MNGALQGYLGGPSRLIQNLVLHSQASSYALQCQSCMPLTVSITLKGPLIGFILCYIISTTLL